MAERTAPVIALNGVDVGRSYRINFKEGTNVTMTMVAVDQGVEITFNSAGGAGGAPADADYLVATSNASLSNEIAVGATPGGELGGTWASPTVDAAHAGGTHLTLGTSPSTQAFGDAASGGAATDAAKTDHKHGMPANPVSYGVSAQNVGTSSAGAASTVSRSDHVHATGAGTPSTQAFGDAAATGSGPAAAMTDHKHAMPANPVSYAAPSLTLGTANAAGAASTLIRSDATILAFDATAPTTSAVGDSAAVGAATVAARRDHAHGREAFGAVTAETTFGGSSANGTATTVAHSDHTHGNPNSTAGPDANITVDAAGAAGTAATAARSGHGHQLATYSSAASAIGTAAAGTSGTAPSRGDHVHSAAYSALTGSPIEYNIYAVDPGSPSILTGGVLNQPVRLQLSSAERLTEAGTGRMTLGDSPYDPALLRYASPGTAVIVNDEFVTETARVSFFGNARKTMVGNARMIATDFKPGGRLVLSGAGGGS